MVRLYVSLLAVALAAGPALAFSDEYYERRSELDGNLYERQLVDSQEIPVSREDHEYFYGREASDDFEARGPNWASGFIRVGSRLLHSHSARKGFEKGASTALDNQQQPTNNNPNSRREVSEDLEVREPNWASGFIRVGSRLLHSHSARKGFEKGASTALDNQQQPNNNNPNSRREVSEDLEAREEELDSREFADFLEARGRGGHGGSRGRSRGETIQTALETAGKGFDAYNNYKTNSRELEPNEDLFDRDLDDEEFFGREFDLDERDIFDDLD